MPFTTYALLYNIFKNKESVDVDIAGLAYKPQA